MTKITIFSGFLGAGKTTLIKKLISEAYRGEKLVLIENEFGQIGIDGGFMKDAGIEVTEMNSGCICCSLVGDFGRAMRRVLDEYHPDRILIEPSGVGKLSDVIGAVRDLGADVELSGFVTVADASKCRVYTRNFGEFYNNQIENASAIILSRTEGMAPEKLEAAVALLRSHNASAPIVTTPWDELSGEQLLAVTEQKESLAKALEALQQEQAHAHHHHHHEHEEGCTCESCTHDHEYEHEHHHHDHEEGCTCESCSHDHEHEHEHHHHDHEEGCTCESCTHDHEHEHHHEHEHEHEHHHHDHEEGCTCESCSHDHEHEHEHHHEHHHHDHEEGCTCESCSHDHEHGHHHHHADEVFTSWGKESPRRFSEIDISAILDALDSERYGIVLRAKGIVPSADGSEWLHFDYVPGEKNIRTGSADYTGRFCVIGSKLDEAALESLFN